MLKAACFNRLTVGESNMKLRFGVVVILSMLTLAGCSFPTGDYDRARKINSIDSYKEFLEKHPYSQYTKITKDKIEELEKAERRKNHVKKNWEKLSKGMSVDEVDSIIGPLNRAAVRSIKNMSENWNGSSGKDNAEKAGSGFPYRDHFFTLMFDAAGKLSSWSLK
jgi:hypothetical protein